MKKKSHRKSSTAELRGGKRRTSPWISGLLVAGIGALCLMPSTRVEASSELDRLYAIETVGFVRAWDNMDGLFTDYVATAYREYFSKQSRFILQDLSKADALLVNSKMDYRKLVEDPKVLSQISRSMRSESIIRTKVVKEGPRYRIVMDWLHAPKMDLIATETFYLEEPKGGKPIGSGDLTADFGKALDRMIDKLPFKAHVTGRDDDSITVNIGENARLKKGDVLVLATLEQVKKHPLLNSIVDWHLVTTGQAVVDQTDEGIAFCKVVEEEPGRHVARYQKVVKIIPKEIPAAPPLIVEEEDERMAQIQTTPTLGWATASLWIGEFNRQYSSEATGTTVGKRGGGLFFGGRAEGQLWLTREWFAEVGTGFGMSSYDQLDIETGVGTPSVGATANSFMFRIGGGYTYYTTGELFGPKGWVKLGFQTLSYNLPVNSTESTGPVGFSGLFLGIGGELPIRHKYGVLLSLDAGFLTGVSESGFTSGSGRGATDFRFFVGGYYRFAPRITLRAGLDVIINGADFSNGTTLTHRIITFAPAALYYF